jgi:hypothetical protein
MQPSHSVLRNAGNRRLVESLGYVLTHWTKISLITVQTCDHSPLYDCIVNVIMNDGKIYSTAYTNKVICWSWLHRPQFYGLRLLWFNKETKILQDNRNIKLDDIPEIPWMTHDIPIGVDLKLYG